MPAEHCCSSRTDAIIPVAEGASKVTLLNPGSVEVMVCDVDGCLVDDESERCDKLLKVGARATLLIELKGRDIEKARRQIESSLRHRNVRPHLVGSISALVVCSKVRVPRFNSYLLRAKQDFAKRYKARFDVKCSGCSVTVEYLCK